MVVSVRHFRVWKLTNEVVATVSAINVVWMLTNHFYNTLDILFSLFFSFASFSFAMLNVNWIVDDYPTDGTKHPI